MFLNSTELATYSVNDGDEQRTVIQEQGIGMGRFVSEVLWRDVSRQSAVWETLYGIHCLQFDVSNLNIMDIFENVCDTVIMQGVLSEMNKL
jgi:hypothetical protein